MAQDISISDASTFQLVQELYRRNETVAVAYIDRNRIGKVLSSCAFKPSEENIDLIIDQCVGSLSNYLASHMYEEAENFVTELSDIYEEELIENGHTA